MIISFFISAGCNIQNIQIVNNSIKSNVNNEYTFLSGSTGASEKGAIFQAFGKDNNASPGYFRIYASTGINSKILEGTPTGALTWNHNDLAGAAIVAKNINTNGYIHFSCGFILQWNRVIGNRSYGLMPVYFSIKFPEAFLGYFRGTNIVVDRDSVSEESALIKDVCAYSAPISYISLTALNFPSYADGYVMVIGY